MDVKIGRASRSVGSRRPAVVYIQMLRWEERRKRTEEAVEEMKVCMPRYMYTWVRSSREYQVGVGIGNNFNTVSSCEM